MRGVILAGGSATRLFPATLAVSKQLLPIFDKPMIFYPLSILMLAGIREILIITRPGDAPLFSQLLGDGSHLGTSITYAEQDQPRGVADGINIAASFIGDERFAYILGDNIFYGAYLKDILTNAVNRQQGATIFAHPVADPREFGVVEVDAEANIISLAEKPQRPKSNLAVTGLYFYDARAVDYVKSISQSSRGELEITDLNACYLRDKALNLEIFGRGFAWFDTGTFENLHAASGFVEAVQQRQGLLISSIEEIAWRNNWITTEDLITVASRFQKNSYGRYLMQLSEKDPLTPY